MDKALLHASSCKRRKTNEIDNEYIIKNILELKLICGELAIKEFSEISKL